MKKYLSLGIFSVLLLPFYLIAGDLTIKGSDTMQVMNQALAQGYMKTNPDVNLSVSGGGSGVGIAALLNNTTDIAAASRLVKPKEEQDFLLQTGAKPKQIAVALDGVAIFVNNANPVSELTIAQLGKIFHGEYTNWNQVGGNDLPINVYSRETSSGTYSFIKDIVLGGTDYTAQAQTLQGTAAVYDAVSKDAQGIGYGGIGYNQGVKLLKVKADDKSEGYLPNEENVEKKVYPLSRTLNFYLNPRSTNPEAERFVDWALGPEGQKIVIANNYYALVETPGPVPTPVPMVASAPAQPVHAVSPPPMLAPVVTAASVAQNAPMVMSSPDLVANIRAREAAVLAREVKVADREAALADREAKLADREEKLAERELLHKTR